MKKRWARIAAGAFLSAMLLIMAGCGASGGDGADAEKFDIKGYMSHTISYREASGDDTTVEELKDAKCCVVGAVQTNNTDDMYYFVSLEAVACDKDGNEIDDALYSFYYEDDSMTSIKKDKPGVVAMNLGAGEKALAVTTLILTDGVEEPDHIEWKVSKSIIKKMEFTSFGLEATNVNYEGGELSCTVNNNSDNDYNTVSISLLSTDDDGYILPDHTISETYSTEGSDDPTPVPAHTSFDYYCDLDMYGSEGSPLPASVEVFVSTDDYNE